MSIKVALNHSTRYSYDRLVALSPQEIRLRPAPHCRTPILSYSLSIKPEKHYVNWQQDAYGNFIARCVVPEKTRELHVIVDLVADMAVINPFDFFVESSAEKFPFTYSADLKRDLTPFLSVDEAGPRLQQWIGDFRASESIAGISSVDFLMALNRRVQRDIRYLVRMEPGVQSCEHTLDVKSGSCRDSGWLMVQLLRHFGLASRFVSGYLIQLAADVKSLDGPSGTERDFTDLHAWAEAYIPGAGWIGLDPTSGLLAGEGHIPLAATASPSSAAPIAGYSEPCQSEFFVEMRVTRLHERPRVTLPYTPQQWAAIDTLGRAIDRELIAEDARLTQGGEPTFVSIDDADGAEWSFTAMSAAKTKLSEDLQQRLQRRFAPGALLYFGQGKWYPGEPLPRWTRGIHWRKDGKPVWRDITLFATADSGHNTAHAKALIDNIAERLGLDREFVMPAYEDPWRALDQESSLALDVDPFQADMKDSVERVRLASQLRRGLTEPVGYVLPLQLNKGTSERSESELGANWESSLWPLRRGNIFLISGDSPLGYRLPLDGLPQIKKDKKDDQPRDPFEAVDELRDFETRAFEDRVGRKPKPSPRPEEIVRTALCVEPRGGILYVYLPPLAMLEPYLALIATIEQSVEHLGLKVRLEGYEPPSDNRMNVLKVTPDPGVIEVNIHPAASWEELVATTTALYEEARLARLATEKFMLDGRHVGTGGGNHVTLGGPTAADSPMLRRPDVLRSLITYWQNHPALSYLFSGVFVGPTSQAPRVDEARDDNLYELEIAFQQMSRKLSAGRNAISPWLVDRLLRNLLVDLTGNTHRAEFCIDKLYSPDTATGRLGIVEFRAFEMPPHSQMSLAQMLLLRALFARFWKQPYGGELIRWGTQLHDRFMLPHFVIADIHDVLRDLNSAGYAFDQAWLAPFVEFRFPLYGAVTYDNVYIELRQAIEPWNVLGEEVTLGTTARYVDSSVERLQVKVQGMNGSRYLVACNGRRVPLAPTGAPGEYVAAIRYRAWAPPLALHPTIGVQSPLTFDLIDTWSGRSIGGCTYHVTHPGGRSFETFPVNANEAEGRRIARFWAYGHTPGPISIKPEPINPAFPMTLDLRWQAD